MADTHIQPVSKTTESEEMYLITIAMAIEDGHDGPVPVSRLAEELEVSKVSANEMVHKLADRGFVEYVPYKGATLSVAGDRVARTILRRRRLWALFLAEQLGLSPAAADTVACEFEHITPEDVAHRLAHFLGDPHVGPTGKPIPSADGTPTPDLARPLPTAAIGRTVEVDHVIAGGADRSFLAGQGIAPGAILTLEGVGADGTVLVGGPQGRLRISGEMAAAVMVT